MKKTTKSVRKLPSQSRARELVDALVQAAAHVLRERGYQRATTNAIAEKAGTSIGSLYQYFPNKEVLVNELIRRLFLEDLEQIERSFLESVALPPKEAWTNMISALANRVENDISLRRTLAAKCATLGGHEESEKFRSSLSRLFLEEFNRRSLPFTEVAAHSVAQIVTFALEGVFRGIILEDKSETERRAIMEEAGRVFMTYLGFVD